MIIAIMPPSKNQTYHADSYSPRSWHRLVRQLEWHQVWRQSTINKLSLRAVQICTKNRNVTFPTFYPHMTILQYIGLYLLRHFSYQFVVFNGMKLSFQEQLAAMPIFLLQEVQVPKVLVSPPCVKVRFHETVGTILKVIPEISTLV